ncbi:MAG: hypothetical protein GC202_05610 [Alphaproteobacteria bacterium]|nr:hypothetical protein [Alphaproteobacteria bacterium]
MLRRELLAGLSALVAAPAFGQGRGPSPFAPQVDYRIDGTFSVPGDGKKPETARIWRSRNALRYEALEGFERTVVARLDLDRAWLALPALHATFETDLSGFGLSPAALRGDGFRLQQVGSERVAGQATTKLRMTRAARDPSFDGFAWVDARGILWKLKGAGEALGQPGTLDWSFANAVVGALPRDTFEPPPGKIVPVAGEALVAMARRFGLVR